MRADSLADVGSLGLRLRFAAAVALVLGLALGIAGCGLFSRSSGVDPRAVRPGEPKASPSGLYIAYADAGPSQRTVKTLVAVIRDKDGDEVFRDDVTYSTRRGVLFAWLSTEPNQLWILSRARGAFRVSPNPSGIWSKQHAIEVPEEVKELRGF